MQSWFSAAITQVLSVTWNPEKCITEVPKKKNEAAELFLTLIKNQHIRTISEGSCDTEDWSNDAENSASLYRDKYILKHITIEAAILNCYNI